MARKLANEPLLPTDDIQGDILPGLTKKFEHLLFFVIDDPTTFKDFLKTLQVTTMTECIAIANLIKKRKKKGIATLVPTPGLNVAFTFSGLQKTRPEDLDAVAGLAALKAGMAAKQAELADPDAAGWTALGASVPAVDGVFIVTGATPAEIANTIALRLAPVGANGWTLVQKQEGQVRPNPTEGHEHFGYADGVSQPGVRGRIHTNVALHPKNGTEDDQADPGQDLLWPGEFLFGYPGQNPIGPDFTVKGNPVAPPVPFMKDGAYLVFRRLRQQVPEFDQAVKSAAAGIGAAFDGASADLLGAQLVGRWKSGAPLVKAPLHDNPALAEGTPKVNDFEFGDDRIGLICPWAAHVRKAYPRDDVPFSLPGDPHPAEEDVKRAEAFTQTHRMMRRGIAFGPELTEAEALAGASDPAMPRGLLFKCYVTSIENQFEFVQQQWVNNGDFSEAGAGVDALIGQPNQPASFLGAAPNSKNPAKKPTVTFDRFVHMEGGEYFFAPSISALNQTV